MQKLPISVCIIAKNEERNIEKCLKTLRNYNWEIVVVDTGSTDTTKEIAQKYADKVLSYTWKQDFAAARNYAAKQAKNPWILVVDCDEYLEQIDCMGLLKAMQEHTKHVGMMTIRNLQKEKGHETYHTDKVPRFYHKGYFHYVFPVHEQIAPIGMKIEDIVLYTYDLPMSIVHTGYCLPIDEMEKKQERNLAILRNAIGRYHYDDYLYFQIGQSCMAMHRLEAAAQAYRSCFMLKPSVKKGFVAVAAASYGKALYLLKRYEEGIAFVKQFEGKIMTPDFIQITGLLYEAKGLYPRALVSWLQIIHSPQREHLGEDAVYDAYVRAIRLQKTFGSMKEAEFFRRELDLYAAGHGKKVTFTE